ncbi:MAG: NADH-quinone oxidoreductase subunit NuoG [Methylohalobius crimeensis]
MVEIEIDDRGYQVQEGVSLLPTCLRLGFKLPYFCWHPALGSVGACRQCAVIQYKDADDSQGKLVMACMTPVRDGLRIGLEQPRARRFRAAVIECLMTNHPHDCPVCEEGGECHLQDMTVMTGHVRRRYRGLKRTHRNQDLGPFINHEMNRCIACYRCLRFYRDYSGGTDLQAFASAHRVYFGRHRDGPLENEFSGNLVEVCPTGVFTDNTFSAHYSRKWDLEYAPGLCPHCAVGCNTSPSARAGTVRRILNRYHPRINGYFLCDRGRFGYDGVNDRPLRPTLNGDPVPSETALDQLRAWLKEGPVLGIGSPKASLEANFALQQLVGRENFFLSLAAPDHSLLNRAAALIARPEVNVPVPLACEESDAILILGEDVTQTAPRLALALRQAVEGRARARAESIGAPAWQDDVVRHVGAGLRHPLYLAVPYTTALNDVATYCHYAAPEDLARLGFTVARALADPGAAGEPAADIAADLAQAERPLIVCGVSCRNPTLIDAAEAIAKALAARKDKPTDLVCIVPECNSLGTVLLGGEALDKALARIEGGEAKALITLEHDLHRRAPAARINAAMERLEQLAVIDAWSSYAPARSTLFLPAAPWTECAGTWINLEGRAQRFHAVQPPAGQSRPAWRWLAGAGAGNWADLEALNRELATARPRFAPLLELAPHVPGSIPRQPHRYSGRTALHAPEQMHEPQPPPDPDSPLVYSMEGLPLPLQPPPLRPFQWQPGWNAHPSAVAIMPDADTDSGVRLLESVSEPDGSRDALSKRKGQTQRSAPTTDTRLSVDRRRWRVVPRYHLFGSEPVSARAAAVVERTPPPYLGLGAEDAAALDLASGTMVQIQWNDETMDLPLRIEHGLAPGLAALPWGLIPWFPPNVEIRLEPSEEQP